MRAVDRDLIRGGHYGQRSWVPHSKAEHMAAPTKGCDVKILLANPEPSTHGPKRTSRASAAMSAVGAQRGPPPKLCWDSLLAQEQPLVRPHLFVTTRLGRGRLISRVTL